MERKMSAATSKLRNLKEFLSSTRTVSTAQSQPYLNVVSIQPTATSSRNPSSSSTDNNYNNYNETPQQKSSRSGAVYRRASKNAISLFNLMSAGKEKDSKKSSHKSKLKSSNPRPISAVYDDEPNLKPYCGSSSYTQSSINPPNKSVSMFGLSARRDDDGDEINHGENSGRNIASRLFYTLRSKFRKRRGDRNNKIVDSKSTDFGSFFAEENNFRSSHSSNRYPLKSSSSVDNVLDSLFHFGSRSPRSSNLPSYSEDPTNQEENEENEYADPELLNPGVDLQELEDDSAFVGNSLVVCPIATPSSSAAPSPSKPIKCLTKELEDLLNYGWYWAGLSKEESEAKLKGQPDGAFVVRDSSSDHYLLSLSFNCNGRTLHTRIEYRNGQFSFYSSDADSFPTVAELIDHCMAYSEHGVFCYSKARRSDYPSYPVRLTKPVSRFTEVKSLLYLSRFVIRQYVRLDLIPQLPLPQSLIEFVAEQRYI